MTKEKNTKDITDYGDVPTRLPAPVEDKPITNDELPTGRLQHDRN